MRVFEWLIQRKADLALLRAFTDYTKRAGEFSDEGMNLDEMAKMHSQEVCSIFSACHPPSDPKFKEKTPGPCSDMAVHQHTSR